MTLRDKVIDAIAGATRTAHTTLSEEERAADAVLALLPPCLTKADPDEPLFILRGHDKAAPATVRLWVHLGKIHGVSDAKIEGAEKIAREMEMYQAVLPERAKYAD